MRLQGAVSRLQTTLCPNSHTPKAVLQTCPDGQRAGNLERSSHEDCDLSNAYGYFYIKQATASAIRASSGGNGRLRNGDCGYYTRDNAYGYCYRKQVAPRPFEQAHGTRFALFLRLRATIACWACTRALLPTMY